jgi:hypothetical protein
MESKTVFKVIANKEHIVLVLATTPYEALERALSQFPMCDHFTCKGIVRTRKTQSILDKM